MQFGTRRFSLVQVGEFGASWWTLVQGGATWGKLVQFGASRCILLQVGARW